MSPSLRHCLAAAVLALPAASSQASAAEPAQVLVDFILKPDAKGMRFVANGVGESGVASAVAEWIGGNEGAKVARLAAAAAPGSNAEPGLRAALSEWTGASRIAAGKEKESVTAFLNAAADRAAQFAGERTGGVDGSTPAPPGSQAALDRARRMRERVGRTSGSVFGRDRSAEESGDGGNASNVGSQGGSSRTRGSGGTRQSRGVLADQNHVLNSGGTTVATGNGDDPAAIAAAQASLLPGANLPANFRNRKYDVPSPTNVPGTVNTVSAVSVEPGSPGSARGGGASEPFVRSVFDASVARLVREGKRRPGTGSINGTITNMGAYYWNDKYLRCRDQADELLKDLAKAYKTQVELDDSVIDPGGEWTFTMTTFTGEGHEATGHYWITAVSKRPEQDTLILDPWKNEIARDKSKSPIAIKPFLPFAMGYFGNLIMPK